MNDVTQTCPLTRGQVMAMYFLEHRARLLDLAAFLDRLDRTCGHESADFREQALYQAIHLLSDGQPHRTARILALLSDCTDELPQSAEGMKGALGAVPLTTGDSE